ncbi:MAG TPA: DUF4350 domain-containing protein, partial [Galbitalea sp.]
MTTTIEERRVQFAEGEVSTPKLRTTARRLAFWIAIALVLVLLAVAGLALGGNASDKARLSATSPGLTGAQALVQVLRQDGVAVTAPRTLTAALAEAEKEPDDTTIALYDPSPILTSTQLRSLNNSASAIVLIEPNTPTLDVFAPDVAQAGAVQSGTARSDCSLGAVRRAGEVSGLGRGYRILKQTNEATGCLGGNGVYSLVRVTEANQTVTVLGSTTVLTNGSILRDGNAALALGLFGATGHLVWYRPSLGDTTGIAQDNRPPPPGWVFPLAILAGLVLVAAGVWRGRRLGALVVERMPVVVRASETLEGRARLYEKSSSRTHALDALRMGTIGRLARLCGLSAGASTDDVVGAVARITGRDPAGLRTLLLAELPTRDSRLVQL